MQLISLRNKAGFTLIELLVVIFILAMLFALIMPNLTGARERAQDANTKQTLNAMKTSLGLYFNDTQAYPTQVPGSNYLSAGFFTTYMPEAASGVGFTYVYTSTSATFQIGTTLLGTYGDDDTNSGLRCGIASPVQGNYYVCGR